MLLRQPDALDAFETRSEAVAAFLLSIVMEGNFFVLDLMGDGIVRIKIQDQFLADRIDARSSLLRFFAFSLRNLVDPSLAREIPLIYLYRVPGMVNGLSSSGVRQTVSVRSRLGLG